MSGHRCASLAAAAHRSRNAWFSATSAWSRRLRVLRRWVVSGTKRGYRQLLTPSCSILHEVCLSRLRKAFRAAHAKSTAAMKSGDYRALGEAIDAEADTR